MPLRWLAGGDVPMGRLVLMAGILAGLAYAQAAWGLAKAAGAPPSRLLPFLAPAQLRYGAEWCMWWPVAATVIASLLRRSLRTHDMRMGSILFDVALALSSVWSVWVGISFLVG